MRTLRSSLALPLNRELLPQTRSTLVD